jgi:hypothetical protein
MFEKLANGILGLFLFMSQWLSPGSSQEEIHIIAARELPAGYEVVCAIDLVWNEQMTDLIDAGIPLRFRMSAWSDAGDTLSFIRTLQCDVGDYSYSFCDSIDHVASPRAQISRNYQQILIALRDYTRWNVTLSKSARRCRIMADLLPSRASRLNRMVDMSEVCGCRRFQREFVKKEAAGVSRGDLSTRSPQPADSPRGKETHEK